MAAGYHVPAVTGALSVCYGATLSLTSQATPERVVHGAVMGLCVAVLLFQGSWPETLISHHNSKMVQMPLALAYHE